MMECCFCHKHCDAIGDPSYFTLEKWECKNHPFSVLFTRYKRTVGPYECVFYVMLDEVKWRIKYYYHAQVPGEKQHITCDISYLRKLPDEVSIGTGYGYTRQVVANFDCDPGITPENALQKLPFITVFS